MFQLNEKKGKTHVAVIEINKICFLDYDDAPRSFARKVIRSVGGWVGGSTIKIASEFSLLSSAAVAVVCWVVVFGVVQCSFT